MLQFIVARKQIIGIVGVFAYFGSIFMVYKLNSIEKQKLIEERSKIEQKYIQLKKDYKFCIDSIKKIKKEHNIFVTECKQKINEKYERNKNITAKYNKLLKSYEKLKSNYNILLGKVKKLQTKTCENAKSSLLNELKYIKNQIEFNLEMSNLANDLDIRNLNNEIPQLKIKNYGDVNEGSK